MNNDNEINVSHQKHIGHDDKHMTSRPAPDLEGSGVDVSSRAVYKICDRGAWAAAVAGGSYAGSADDLRDGFIHLSAADQLAGTAAKHFRGQTDLRSRGLRSRSARRRAEVGAVPRRRAVSPPLWRRSRRRRRCGCAHLPLDAVGRAENPRGLDSMLNDAVRSGAAGAVRPRAGARPRADARHAGEGPASPAILARPAAARRDGCFGLAFPNPLGVAAGFDKDARVPDALLAMGLGFCRDRHRDAAAASGQSATARLPPDRGSRLSSTGSASTTPGMRRR